MQRQESSLIRSAESEVLADLMADFVLLFRRRRLKTEHFDRGVRKNSVAAHNERGSLKHDYT